MAETSSAKQSRIAVSQLHELAIYEFGNPDGIPAVFLHGGPGGGFSEKSVATFDLSTYRVIGLDQRGAGKSTPFASIEENTTQDLVADLEKLREKLGIDRWLVAGGSWGSCLALAYAIAHPERCLGLRIHGIFLGEKSDVQWWFHGCRAIFPDYWQEFAEFVPEDERHDLLAAYLKRLTCGDDDLEMDAAVSLRRFSGWTQTLEPSEDHVRNLLQGDAALAVSRIFTYYCNNGAFMPEGYLIANIDRIRHLPAEIIQARYDTVTPMMTAWKLHQAWPEARFTIVTLANHVPSVKPMAEALSAATMRLADQIRAG